MNDLYNEVFDDHTTVRDRAIVMPNHLSGTIKGTNGDRAYHLNEATGLTVVVFERPGTGSMPERETFTIDGYREDVAERAEWLQTFLGDKGFEAAILGHDSAGATDSLALAASGKMAVERVIAIEPVSMIVLGGGFGTYAMWGRDMITDNKGKRVKEFIGLKELEHRRDEPSLFDLKGPTLKEARIYKPVYTSDVGRDLLRLLKVQGVPVQLIFGDKSHTTPSDVQMELVDEFEGTSIDVQIYPNAPHGFTQPFHHFVYVFNKALQTEPVQP